MFYLSTRSKQRLLGVHPDLVAVVRRAIQITTRDFSVSEGLRSRQRQYELVQAGKSQTMNSRHLTGHAVDLLPYPFNGDMDKDGVPSIEDWDEYYPQADAMIQAAKELNVPLRWGGNWRVKDVRTFNGSARDLHKAYPGSFPDGPHMEIPAGYGYD